MVDYDALTEALKSGSLRGAAHRDFRRRADPVDLELLRLDNVTLTPHIAGASLTTIEHAADAAAEEVRRYLAGEGPLNPCGVTRGRGPCARLPRSVQRQLLPALARLHCAPKLELCPMKSRWSDLEFRSVVDGYVGAGLNLDLATRVYTTRLLGGDPQLVLHGGGNTSVKTVVSDADGSEVPVICVKGSGWDMGTIEPAGLPAVRLAELAALARFDALSDMEMVRQQRRLLDGSFRAQPIGRGDPACADPGRHVDHTHANAIVALTDQPDGEALVREIFPDAVVVPYVMPGFVLAKACAKALAAAPDATSMILIEARNLHLVR